MTEQESEAVLKDANVADVADGETEKGNVKEDKPKKKENKKNDEEQDENNDG